MNYRFFVSIIVTTGFLWMLSGCKGSDNPVGPDTNTVTDSIDALPKTSMLKDYADGIDGFEATDITLQHSSYRPSPTENPLPFMASTTAAHHSGSRCLTSDSNSTGIERICIVHTTGVIGISFWMMAASSGKTNLFAALGKSGSSSMGAYYYFGLGFDKSDSIKYVYATDETGAGLFETSKTIAPIQFGHWYKCRVEFEFPPDGNTAAQKRANWYVDGKKIASLTTTDYPSRFDMWLALRDGAGAQGQKPYYIDDLMLYYR